MPNDISVKSANEVEAKLDDVMKKKVPSRGKKEFHLEEETETKVEEQKVEEKGVETDKQEEPAKPAAPVQDVRNMQYISSTFAQLAKDTSIMGAVNDRKLDINDILGNVKIDLNHIEISSGVGDIEYITNRDIAIQSRAVKQVICFQSGYSVEISGLRHQEIQTFMEDDIDWLTYKKKLYRFIYNHAENFSFAGNGRKPSFQAFLDNTSYFDTNTLLYGLYCQTFPYHNSYNVRCIDKECRESFTVGANSDTLIDTTGKDLESIVALRDDIIQRKISPEEVLAKSILHKKYRFILEHSKIIVDAYIPSISDYLDKVLSHSNEAPFKDKTSSLSICMFIDKMYLPNVTEYAETKKLRFIERSDLNSLVDIIAQLDVDDGKQLTEELDDFISKYQIDYSIKAPICPKCGKVLPNIPVDMEQLIFQMVRQERQEGKNK